MEIFYAIAGAGALGIIYVLWQLMNDKGTEISDEPKIEKLLPDHIFDHNKLPEIDLRSPQKIAAPSEAPAKKSGFSLSQLLKSSPKEEKPVLGETPRPPKKEDKEKGGNFLVKIFSKKKTSEEIEEYNDELSETLRRQMGINKTKESASKFFDSGGATGTEAMKIPSPNDSLAKTGVLSVDEEKKIEKEINSSLELSDLKLKFHRTDKLLKERTDEVEDLKQNLDNEIKNRKEFNKVKDLLEKELAETKDKSRKAHNELMSTQAESESQKKRIAQFEDKVKALEKQIYDKEKEIEELSKKLNHQASSAKPVLSIPMPKPQDPPGESSAPSATDISPTIDDALKDPWAGKKEPAEASTPMIQPPEETAPETPQDEKPEFLSLKPDVLEDPKDKPSAQP